MNELWQQALVVLRGMWHRRWVGLAAAWIAAIVGVAVVFRIPERYEANARVYVDTESLLRPLLAGLAIQPNIDQQVALMSRTLISRPNVEKLVRMADLDLRVPNPAQRDDLIDAVTKKIKLTGGAGAGGARANNLYLLSYTDSNPQLALKVVQSLLAIFVEQSLGDKRQDTQTAVKFIDDQIKRYEEQLKASEERLKQFRLKYMGVTGREGQDHFSRMMQARAEIENAKMELEQAEQTRDSYKKEVAGETPTLLSEPTAPAREVTGPSATDLDQRLALLHRSLDSLLLKYTDSHPDVQNAKRLIAELEGQKKAEEEARRLAAAKSGASGAAAAAAVDRNPVFQQLRIQLADAEARVASAKAKLASYQSLYDRLNAQARMVPEVEAEFAQLNRDYDVQKKTYENLLARRESAGMGVDVQDAGGAQFRVIDPPRVMPDPVPPDRKALLALAFVVALALGLAVSFIASQLRPTFHDSRTLRDATKRPILGSVSVIPRPEFTRRRRRSAILFVGGLGGLLASFTAVFAFVLLIGRVA